MNLNTDNNPAHIESTHIESTPENYALWVRDKKLCVKIKKNVSALYLHHKLLHSYININYM